jgi:hypothetical protein
MEIKEYPYVTCKRKKGRNIVFSDHPKCIKVDLAVAKEIVANRLEFTRNEKHYVIIDISNIKEVTPEAKEYMQHPDGGLKNILGAAFIADNPVAELIATIYIKTPGGVESRFFHHKEEAIKWLEECIRNDGHTSNDKIVS